MICSINLSYPLVRITVVLATLVMCASLSWLIYGRFVIDILATKSTLAQQPTLAAALSSFPNSARLQARYADLWLTQILENPQARAQAETAAEQAVKLSPFNAKNYLLLAATKGAGGDLKAEATQLRAALALAPHNTQIHWRLANVLLRSGNTEQALDEFQNVTTADPTLLPVSLDLLWQIAGNDPKILERATGEKTKNRLQLAQFLLQKSRVDDALHVVQQIDREARVAAPEITDFVNNLMASGQTETAHQIWLDSVAENKEQRPLLWNGSFETASPHHLSQFDWQLRSNEYVQLAIDSDVAHTGTKSLRLDFFGRDTTRLSNEIKQTIVLHAGVRYRLTCFVRTAKFFSPEGPRVTVTTPDGTRLIATSNPIHAEADWQPLTLDFNASAPVLLVTVQRIPKTSYDEPTQGTLWFDDFTLTELP